MIVFSLILMTAAPNPPECNAECRAKNAAYAAEHPERHGFSVVGLVPRGNSDQFIVENDNITGERGTTIVKFHVNDDGRVRDCSVIRTSGSKVLDEKTCSLLIKRGRFQPPHNVDQTGAYKHVW